jgi:hypothetical protein
MQSLYSVPEPNLLRHANNVGLADGSEHFKRSDIGIMQSRNFGIFINDIPANYRHLNA